MRSRNLLSGSTPISTGGECSGPRKISVRTIFLGGNGAPICAAFGCEADLHYSRNYPSMVNSEAETEYAIEAAKRVSGDCEESPLVMGGEDFSFMLNARPGAYILVGNGDTAMVHTPDYNFNDDAIPAGCSWYVEMAESRLPL